MIERGWARPEALPDGIERDDWDEEAVLVAGSVDGETVACARLVLPRPGLRLRPGADG